MVETAFPMTLQTITVYRLLSPPKTDIIFPVQIASSEPFEIGGNINKWILPGQAKNHAFFRFFEPELFKCWVLTYLDPFGRAPSA